MLSEEYMAGTEPISGPPALGRSAITVPQAFSQAPSLPKACISAIEKPVPRDLWREALESLNDVDQSAIKDVATPKASTSEALDYLLELTKSKGEAWAKKRWRFRFQGKEVIARDVVNKITFWLNKFKGVGDVAVNFDPIHAALPWACVRFLLLTVTAEHDQMGHLLIVIEKISCLISRGAIYERLYDPIITTADALANLHRSMIKQYAIILEMTVLCRQIFDKNFAKRTIHAIFNPDEISALMQNCDKLESQVEFEAQNCERLRGQQADAKSKELLDSFNQPILRTDLGVLKLLETMSKTEHWKLLDWISDIPYGNNHQTVYDQRTTGTCDWLIDSDRYKEWQETSGSILLWLCGTAGTGKTYLTSRVIDEIAASLNSKQNQEGFAYFYCNRNEAKRREPLSVLTAFVRQLSTTAWNEQRNSVHKSVKEYYEEARRKAEKLTMNDCKKLLLILVNDYPRTTLVLDALDECEMQQRLELVEIFDELLLEASNPLRIFISSRPDGDIRYRLKERATLEISAKDNFDDIAEFVKSEITKHTKAGNWKLVSENVQHLVRDTLLEKSQGMFQWAFLQIRQLLVLRRDVEIRKHLGKLPKDLKSAYDNIYSNMSEEEKVLADRAFQWVMCACAPPSTKELLPAICQDETGETLAPIDVDEDLVLEYCHNLIVIDPVRQVWVPSHLSVLEYFEENHWTLQQANALVANISLLVLQNTLEFERERAWRGKDAFPSSYYYLSGFEHINERGETTGLRDPLEGQNFEDLHSYARNHWMLHAQRSVVTGRNSTASLETLRRNLGMFLGLPRDSSAAYRCWHRISRDSNSTPDTSGLRYDKGSLLMPTSIASFAFCAFELGQVLPDWYEFDWVEQDDRTDIGFTLLELAAWSGSVATCRDLIDHGAKVNVLTESLCGSALAAAARQGNLDVVRYLVQEGAAIDLQVGWTYGSALVTAAYEGQLEVVRYLVQEGAAIDLQVRGKFGSALSAAARAGRLDIVRYLVQEGGDVDLQVRGMYGSALAATACQGNLEIVRYLVEKGATIDLQIGGSYGSALAAAASFHLNIETVRYLVQKGAVVDLQLSQGFFGSALTAVAVGAGYEAERSKDWEEILAFMLESGANINMRLIHSANKNALEAAKKARYPWGADMLREHGAKEVDEDVDI